MDRFEVRNTNDISFILSKIYIPVWIDLKRRAVKTITINFKNLHSSMDRFEDVCNGQQVTASRAFTFQYG